MTSKTRVTGSARRVPFIATVVVALGLLTAACGSTNETATPSVASLPDAGESAAEPGDLTGSDEESEEPEVSEADAEAAQLRYEKCLDDNGVNFGDLSGDDDSSVQQLETEGDIEDFNDAMAECEEILEDTFGEFELSPEQQAEFADAEAKFNACLAENGFTIEDGVMAIEEDDFEASEAALEECNEVFEQLNEQLGDDQ